MTEPRSQASDASAVIPVVAFTIDESRYALPVAALERVVRAVEITPLPGGPEVILGVINVQGKLVAVGDVRQRFHLPRKALGLSDIIIIAKTPTRRLALVADRVDGVLEYREGEIVSTEELAGDVRYVDGVVKSADGLLLIHNLDRFLELEESRSLERALANV